MNNWFFLVLSKNPKKNPPNATIGPVTLLFPLFAAHTHCLVPIHSYDPARPCSWGRHPATPRPTRAEGIARPSQGRPLVLLPVRRSWRCSPFCSPYVHARRAREKEKAGGLRRRPCCPPFSPALQQSEEEEEEEAASSGAVAGPRLAIALNVIDLVCTCVENLL